MRLLDALRSASERLERAGIEDPHIDAEMIVLHATGTGRLEAYTQNPEISRQLGTRISSLVRRRLRGEPVQYIIGSVEFLGLLIRVRQGVLIPRPETELLVQEAVAVLKTFDSLPPAHHPARSVLDLCTGSGCIALAVAHAAPEASVTATDISAKAIRTARRNAEENGINTVKFLRGSLFEPLKKNERFDLIVSNPPYIRSAEIATLQREVREWEPVEALDGGPDGLGFYRRIFAGAGALLNDKGMVFLEIGYDQGSAVRELAEQAGYTEVTVLKDLAGLDRIVKARR